MRCSYPQCENPTQSSRFYQINGNKQAGNQDWRPLNGWVLCRSCFSCYNTRGTLTRKHNHDKVPAPPACLLLSPRRGMCADALPAGGSG